MKLSKAQQEVVDKMRKGWRLTRDDFWWWSNEGLKPAMVKSPTIDKLIEYGIICMVEKSVTVGNRVVTYKEYYLTEQYKTQPDEK